MFENPFSHFLSYGASDQHTVRELRDTFDGLLVPGTVAAFQREGTGGFVLALSASDAQTPYVIDPRSPLFQQTIATPKKSHTALKAILGLPDSYVPVPGAFTDELVGQVAEKWARFNCSYKTDAGAKFDKYAKRLGDVSPSSASEPKLVLAPYFVSESTSDPWWEVSSRLLAKTRSSVTSISGTTKCVRVVAAASASALHGLLEALSEEKDVAIWVSGLNELESSAEDLIAYGRAIRDANMRGQRLFALYGGFFSVVLAGAGLRGSSHGIGYGENRKWVELPTSGPPPSRYYLPELHRYVRPELADVLWGAQVSHCACPICEVSPPILLDYHELMMHSVHCRAKEIKSWRGLSLADSAARLKAERDEFLERLGNAKIQDEPFKTEAAGYTSHLLTWMDALTRT